MKRILDNLAFLLPVLALACVMVYVFWLRDRPRAEGRITGDYAAARELADTGGLPLYVAVDTAPN